MRLLGGEYSPAADVWSCGASLYRLVACEDPFLHDHVQADAAAIQKLEAAAIPWLPTAVFAAATKEGKKFLYNCMRAKLASRWSSADATKFALRTWLPAARRLRDGDAHSSGGSAASGSPESPHTSLARLQVDVPAALAPGTLLRQPSEPFTPRSPAAHSAEVCASMRKYASYSDLKRAALIVAAHQTDHRHAESLRLAFNALDTTATGGVRVGDLRDALRDHVADAAEIDVLFEKLDHDRSGVVHYHEFLAATMESRPDLLDDEVLRDAFDRLDSDDTGCISEQNLTEILGKSASTANVRQMIADGDFKKNGSIDFDEFTTLMRTPSAPHQDDPPPRQDEAPLRRAAPERPVDVSRASFNIVF
jgi:Ca2+-binding EF-hand superfamily protein